MTLDPSNLDTKFRLPWSVKPSCSKIGIRYTLALSQFTGVVLFQVTSETLVTAVASTVQSDNLSGATVSSPPRGEWTRGFENYQLFTREFELEPTLPADRRVALKFSVRFGQGITGDWGPLASTSRKALLHALECWDILDPPPPESAP